MSEPITKSRRDELRRLCEHYRDCNDHRCPTCFDAEDNTMDTMLQLLDALDAAETKLAHIPKIEDVELALRANNTGGLEFREDYCQCDSSVGQSPCPYCAIDSVLQRLRREIL